MPMIGRTAHQDGPEVYGEVAERRAVRSGLELESGLAGLACGLRDAGHGIVDCGRGEIDFDVGARPAQRRLELDRQRSIQPAEIEAPLRARRLVEGQGQGRRAFLPRRPADVQVGRRAEQLAVAGHLQRVAIGLEGEIPLIELLLADEFVEREVGERAGGAKLRVIGLGGFPELEVENEVPLRLPLDRRRIDLQARLLAQRLAAEQIGERVGRAAQMGLRPARRRSAAATYRGR